MILKLPPTSRAARRAGLWALTSLASVTYAGAQTAQDAALITEQCSTAINERRSCVAGLESCLGEARRFKQTADACRARPPETAGDAWRLVVENAVNSRLEPLRNALEPGCGNLDWSIAPSGVVIKGRLSEVAKVREKAEEIRSAMPSLNVTAADLSPMQECLGRLDGRFGFERDGGEPRYAIRDELDFSRTARLPDIADCADVARLIEGNVAVRDYERFWARSNGVKVLCQKTSSGAWREDAQFSSNKKGLVVLREAR